MSRAFSMASCSACSAPSQGVRTASSTGGFRPKVTSALDAVTMMLRRHVIWARTRRLPGCILKGDAKCIVFSRSHLKSEHCRQLSTQPANGFLQWCPNSRDDHVEPSNAFLFISDTAVNPQALLNDSCPALLFLIHAQHNSQQHRQASTVEPNSWTTPATPHTPQEPAKLGTSRSRLGVFGDLSAGVAILRYQWLQM